jgi:hypothetical protein
VKYAWLAQPYNTTDAMFRLWGASIAPALSAIGLVQTSDTGQINWTTVLAPTTTNQYRGYEIWRLNDSLQGTAPVFFKIEYGSSNAAVSPSLRISVGKGSDGAGTITNQIVQLTTGFNGANSIAFSYASSSSGGSGFSLYLSPFNGSGQTSPAFCFERSLDSAGNPTIEGIMVASSASAASLASNWQAFRYSTPSSSIVWTCPITLPGTISGASLAITNGTSITVAKTMVLPIPIYCPGVTPWTSKQLLGILPGDAVQESLFDISIYGTTHRYKAFPVINLAGAPVSVGSTSATSTPAAIIWE